MNVKVRMNSDMLNGWGFEEGQMFDAIKMNDFVYCIDGIEIDAEFVDEV